MNSNLASIAHPHQQAGWNPCAQYRRENGLDHVCFGPRNWTKSRRDVVRCALPTVVARARGTFSARQQIEHSQTAVLRIIRARRVNLSVESVHGLRYVTDIVRIAGWIGVGCGLRYSNDCWDALKCSVGVLEGGKR